MSQRTVDYIKKYYGYRGFIFDRKADTILTGRHKIPSKVISARIYPNNVATIITIDSLFANKTLELLANGKVSDLEVIFRYLPDDLIMAYSQRACVSRCGDSETEAILLLAQAIVDIMEMPDD